MGWREVAKPMFANHNDKGVSVMAAIAPENDLAEGLGFTYEPDPKRGHGWGRFRKGAVLVVEVVMRPRNKPEVLWARYERNLKPTEIFPLANRTVYHKTLENALKAEAAVGHSTKYGAVWYVNGEEAVLQLKAAR